MSINIENIISAHKLFLAGDPAGVKADLSGADLSRADLSWADLCGADLSGADLRDADLRKAGLIVLYLPNWAAYITNTHISIGCQRHTIDEWFSFSDSSIAKMDADALDWWAAHKPCIQSAVTAVLSQKGEIK